MKKMKVIGLLAVMLVMVLAFSGTANAFDTHSVKQGDSLWKIGIQHGGRSWKEIYKDNKKQIKNPDLIYPGQVFVISDEWDEFFFENPGEDKYTGTPEEALELLGYPEEASKLFIKKIREDNFDGWHEISKGDRFAMVFGKNKIRYNTVANWKDENKKLASKKYSVITEGIEYALLHPLVCGNWSRLKNIEISLPSPKGLVQGMDSKTELEQGKIIAGKPIKKKVAEGPREFHPEDVMEAYLFAGYNDNVHGHIKSWGYYVGGKIRLIPFKSEFKRFRLKYGLFANGALGEGKSNGYSWSSKGYDFGLSLKPYGSNWDASLDLGIFGERWGRGGKGKYRSKQKQRVYSLATDLSGYERRLRGEKWFPKWTLDGSYILPYNVQHKHSFDGKSLKPNPYNAERWDVGLTSWIYDWWSKDGAFRLTPGLRLGGGHDFGPDAGFWRIDAPVQFATYKYTVLKLSVGYKEQLGGDGDVWQANASLNLVGVIDLIRVSRIREAYKEELDIPINIHN